MSWLRALRCAVVGHAPDRTGLVYGAVCWKCGTYLPDPDPEERR